MAGGIHPTIPSLLLSSVDRIQCRCSRLGSRSRTWQRVKANHIQHASQHWHRSLLCLATSQVIQTPSTSWLLWNVHRPMTPRFLQVFALFMRPKKEHKYSVYWNAYHHSVGYIVILLGIYNVFRGLSQHLESWSLMARCLYLCSYMGFWMVYEQGQWLEKVQWCLHCYNLAWFLWASTNLSLISGILAYVFGISLQLIRFCLSFFFLCFFLVVYWVCTNLSLLLSWLLLLYFLFGTEILDAALFEKSETLVCSQSEYRTHFVRDFFNYMRIRAIASPNELSLMLRETDLQYLRQTQY